MSFGSTLFTLRKSKNMSQESLARELNTSRQAVSKWENDQGFPEMDKLLMMSNLFNVTVDYLLKGENAEGGCKDGQGYYASSETIEGFLVYVHSVVKLVSLGVFFFVMSGAPYLLFPAQPTLYTVAGVFLIVAGIGTILAACFKENRWKKITEEPLYIDNTYLAELRSRYASLKKKYLALLTGGIGLCAASLAVTSILEEIYQLGLTGYHTMALLLLSAGVSIIIYAAAAMWAFGVVSNNSEHIRKKKPEKIPVNFWRIIAVTVLCFAALALIYIVTGGEGHIANFIDKLIMKL